MKKQHAHNYRIVNQAIKVESIPNSNIGVIEYNSRIMIWQNLIQQYCYLG